MRIVTFTSDFGTSDHYVAAVKATLLSAKPDAQIVDISHDIAPFDLAHMAYTIRSVYEKFPKGSIHLIGSNGKAARQDVLLLTEIDEHIFIAPDNGVLSLINDRPLAAVYTWTDEAFSNFPTLKAASLVGRLLQGESMEALGELSTSYTQLMLRQPKATRKEISGHVIRVDHYGNLVTNIKKLDFDILSRDRRYSLHFGRETSNRVHSGIHEVDPGEAFFIFNHEGLLLIGINQGHAAQLLGLSFDSPVYIQFED